MQYLALEEILYWNGKNAVKDIMGSTEKSEYRHIRYKHGIKVKFTKDKNCPVLIWGDSLSLGNAPWAIQE